MFDLPSIARPAKGLSVLAFGLTAGRHASDVIEFEVFCGAAPHARGAEPVAKLRRVEADASRKSASLSFGQVHDFRIVRGKPPGGTVASRLSAVGLCGVLRQFDHKGGSRRPVAFPGTKSNAASLLFCPLDGRRESLKRVSAHFAGKSDLGSIPVAADTSITDGGRKALHAAEPHLATLGFGRAVECRNPIKRDPTDLANRRNLWDRRWHVFSSQRTSGEVGEHQHQPGSVRYKNYAIPTSLAIPNQAAHVTGQPARGAEGVTTRACGNNNSPTSARRHSIGDEIVWSVVSSWCELQRLVINRQVKNTTTFRRYSGYDILNISPSDVFTAAQYPIAQAAAAVTISGLEMLQNSGKEKMLDLLDSRISNAETTMRNNISNDCYSNGLADGGKQIGGLALLVADVNNSGTVGGIDSGTWGFWQNNVQSFATNGLTPGTATMQTQMNRAWLAVARQADRPDLFIADNTYFRYYWESLQAIQRIQSERDGMAGFMSLKFMDADVVFDGGFQGTSAGNVSVLGSGGSWLSGSGAPASHMFVLNTEYLYLRPHQERNFTALDPDRFSVNQDAMVKLIAWAGNATCSNRFLQSVIIA